MLSHPASARLSALVPWLVGALVALVYLPALYGGFLWCDDYTFSASPLLDDRAGLGRIWSATETEQYYPVTYSAYWVLAQGFGRTPLAPHLASLLLHAVNAALFVLVWRRLDLLAAAFAALLFALHPLQVESVAWIYELKNVLSTSLLLLTTLAHLRYLRGGGARWLAITTATFGMALLAKSAVLVYPALALIVLPRSDRQRLRRSLVLLGACSVAMATLTVWYERNHTGALGGEWPQSLTERIAIAGHVFWFYLGKMAWPHPLSFAYPRFVIDASGWRAFAPTALALLAVIACLAIRRMRSVGWWLAAYGVAVFPVLGFFNIYMMRYTFVADHLAYLPSLIVLPYAASSIARAHRWLPIAVITAVAALTLMRVPLFQSDRQLWQHAIAVDDRAWLAHAGLAKCLQEAGNAEAAFPHYQRALEINPRAIDVRHLYASALANAGHLDAALLQYKRLLEIDPRDQRARHNRDSLIDLLSR